jgi:hypothetical protein
LVAAASAEKGAVAICAFKFFPVKTFAPANKNSWVRHCLSVLWCYLIFYADNTWYVLEGILASGGDTLTFACMAWTWSAHIHICRAHVVSSMSTPVSRVHTTYNTYEPDVSPVKINSQLCCTHHLSHDTS